MARLPRSHIILVNMESILEQLPYLEMQAAEEEWDQEQIFDAFRKILIEEDVLEGFGEYD